MRATVKVESAAFSNALRRYHGLVRKDTEKFILRQSALFAQQAIQMGFPRTYQKGRNSVTKDIHRAITPLSDTPYKKLPATFDNITDQRLRKRLNQLIKSKNYSELEYVMQNVLKRGGARVVPFDRSFHRKARNSRGRVRKYQNVFTPDKMAWVEYREEKRQLVGLYKSGWVGALQRLQGMGVAVKMPPKWITKHRNKRPGTGRKISSGPSMVFEMINPYGYHHDAKNTVLKAMRARANAINKGIKYVLDGDARAAGFLPR